jgi:acyl carrier protein
MKGIRENDPFNDSTVLIGSEAAILDSLGVVMLAVQLEEELAAVSGSKTFLAQRLLEQDLQEETIGSIVRRIHGMAEARS